MPTMTSTQRQDIGLVLLLAFLTAVCSLSVDTYLPALPTIAASFGVSSAVIQRSVTTFFLGITVGQLIAGPLSDRYGRRPVLLTGFTLYFFATLGCALAPSALALITIRGLQGLAASASLAVVSAIVRDRWAGDGAARVMSHITMALITAPLIAPSLGAFILVHWGWRPIFWMLLLFAISAWALIFWRLPETNSGTHRDTSSLLTHFRAYAPVLRNPQALAYLLCGCLSYAATFAYVTGASFVYIEFFHVPVTHFGFYFAINVAGVFLCTWLNSLLVERYGYHRMLTWGVLIALVGVLLLLCSSFFAVGGFIAIATGLFITLAPSSLIGANCTAGLLTLYPNNAGAASALFGVIQFGSGTIASLLVGLLYTGTPTALALTMTLCCVGAFLSMLWLQHHLKRQHEVSTNMEVPSQPE